MLQKLKVFYHRHKNTRGIASLYRLYSGLAGVYHDARVLLRLVGWKFSKKPADRPIRVCFLQQDPNCWNKSKALYDLLKGDDRFAVSLLCVPDPYDADTGSTYRFFAENGYDAVDARVGDGPWNTIENAGGWFDLRALQPDYVFYQQPYDGYLPKAYRSRYVAKYTRICLTPYGIALTKELLDCMEYDFLKSVYCLYAVTETERRFNAGRFALSHKLGLRHSKYLGTLVFCDLFSHKEEVSASWDFSKNSFRAIWTPRWTTDPKIGGSNFFRYKDFLPEYARQNPQTDILFRPHPMAFANFVRGGQMTQPEVDAYIDLLDSAANTALDRQKGYDATFWQSSVLISDISAVMVEYFVTGKPIIFCETEERTCTYLDMFQKMLSVCYIARDQQELAGYLDQLQAGCDPLQSARREMIRELFGEDLTDTARSIARDLLRDFGK